MQFSHLEENVGFQSWYLLFKGFVDWYTTVVSQPRPKRKGEMVTKCLVCKTIVWYSWFWLASNILTCLMIIFSFTTAYDLITEMFVWHGTGAETLPVEYTSNQVWCIPYGDVWALVAPPCHQILNHKNNSILFSLHSQHPCNASPTSQARSKFFPAGSGFWIFILSSM